MEPGRIVSWWEFVNPHFEPPFPLDGVAQDVILKSWPCAFRFVAFAL
jgi:hypothetical protein